MNFQVLQAESLEMTESVVISEANMNIFVRLHNGNGQIIIINQKTTLETFKKTLQESSLEFFSKYELIFKGKAMNKPKKLLIDYGIKDQSVIHIENKSKSPNKMKIDIGIFYKNEKVYIRMLTNQTVYDLKQKIYRLLEIYPKEQKLIFKGMVLQNPKRIIEYNIGNDSLISLFVKVNAKSSIRERSNDLLVYPKELLKNATSMRYVPQLLINSIKSFESCKKIDETNHNGYEIDIKENEQKMSIHQGKQFNFQLFKEMFKESTEITFNGHSDAIQSPFIQGSDDWCPSFSSQKEERLFQAIRY